MAAADRDRLVLEHVPLVKSIAIRLRENLPRHIDVDDLVHSGILGLFDAIAKYRPERKVAFATYARYRIRGAILDSLRELDWASRDVRRRHKQVEAVARELSLKLQRIPTEAEMAGEMGVEAPRWRRIARSLQCAGLVSMSARPPEREDAVRDYPANPETQPLNVCARNELRRSVRMAMETLPHRYRRVIALYYTREMTMRQIGGLLGVNESRVCQIHKSALVKMGAALGSAGVHSSAAFRVTGW